MPASRRKWSRPRCYSLARKPPPERARPRCFMVRLAQWGPSRSVLAPRRTSHAGRVKTALLTGRPRRFRLDQRGLLAELEYLLALLRAVVFRGHRSHAFG